MAAESVEEHWGASPSGRTGAYGRRGAAGLVMPNSRYLAFASSDNMLGNWPVEIEPTEEFFVEEAAGMEAMICISGDVSCVTFPKRVAQGKKKATSTLKIINRSATT